MYKYFKKIGYTDYISMWKFDEVIKLPTTPDDSLAPALS